jgi:malonyl-CoA/methylmalonyl-CoA synthetase
VIARAGRRDEIEGERLRDWAKQRIAPYKVPKRVVVLDDFPRNPVGKVVKPELCRRLRGEA